VTPFTVSPSDDAARGSARPGADAAAARDLEHRLIDSVVNKTEIAQLPALPVFIDLALKSIRHPADVLGPVRWISLDPILTLRLLDATVDAAQTEAGSDFRSLEQRFNGLQPELAQALMISSVQASLGPGRHTLSSGELAGFWFHSLQCAYLSRAFARAISYQHPDEAYLAGLLHDIGTFALLTAVPRTFRSLVAERGLANANGCPEHAGRLGTVHAKIGATLTRALALPAYFSDALLLHHAPAPELYGAHPLVRIVGAAEALSHPGASSAQLASVAELLDISPLLVSHLEKETAREVTAVLRDLGLTYPRTQLAKPLEEVSAPSIAAMAKLSESIVGKFVDEAGRPSFLGPPATGAACGAAASEVRTSHTAGSADTWRDAMSGTGGVAASILEQIISVATLSKAAAIVQSAPTLPRAVSDIRPVAAAVAGLKRVLLFVSNSGEEAWSGWLIDDSGTARVALNLATAVPHSVVARAAREGVVSASMEENPGKELSGLDMQIARLLSSEEIAAVPVPGKAGGSRAVLVFGTSHLRARRLSEKLPFLTDLASLISQAFAQPAPAGEHLAALESPDTNGAATREQVHEIRDSLSVLKANIRLVRDRARNGASVERELEIVSEEVERVAKLLDEIGGPGAREQMGPGQVERDGPIEEGVAALLDEQRGSDGNGRIETVRTDVNHSPAEPTATSPDPNGGSEENGSAAPPARKVKLSMVERAMNSLDIKDRSGAGGTA
jgi:HD-like signal output (HDOD) protein